MKYCPITEEIKMNVKINNSSIGVSSPPVKTEISVTEVSTNIGMVKSEITMSRLLFLTHLARPDRTSVILMVIQPTQLII
jgi:hypothetical protein